LRLLFLFLLISCLRRLAPVEVFTLFAVTTFSTAAKCASLRIRSNANARCSYVFDESSVMFRIGLS
jgi:hypothetical protein